MTPRGAKYIIAKLVKAHNDAWASHEKLDITIEDSYTYKKSLNRALTYSEALRTVGIVANEYSENL